MKEPYKISNDKLDGMNPIQTFGGGVGWGWVLVVKAGENALY